MHQNLLRSLIAADFETQAQMLHCVTTHFIVTEKVSLLIEAARLKLLADDPPEPDDEIEAPK